MIVILNLLPIILHIILLCVFKGIRPGDLSMIELVYNSVVMPIYLIMMNKSYIWKHSVIKFMILSLILVCNILLSYIVWGVTTNNLWRADPDTIHVFKTEFYIGEFILIAGWALKSIISSKKRRE